MRALVTAMLTLLLTACTSNGGGNYPQRGPYGGSVQQQPVATNQLLQHSPEWGGKSIPHNHFQNRSQI